MMTRAQRAAVLVPLVAAGLACSGLVRPRPVGPSLPRDLGSLELSAPDFVSARRGDTLAKIAKRHGVTAAELRDWNGPDVDELDAGEILLVWSRAAPAPPPRPAPAVAPASPEAGLTVELAPIEEPAAPTVETARTGVVIERPAVAGVLGMKAGGDVDLSDAVAELERFDSAERSQLGSRSLTRGTSAEGLTMPSRPAPTLDPDAPYIPDGSVAPPRLAKPAPKQCLAGGGVTEIGVDGSVTGGGGGIGLDAIRLAMAQIGRSTIRCFPAGSQGGWVVEVEVTVGCDGRVSHVALLDGGGVPSAVSSCVTQTIGYASFPAHGTPGGVTFQYPMRFTF